MGRARPPAAAWLLLWAAGRGAAAAQAPFNFGVEAPEPGSPADEELVAQLAASPQEEARSKKTVATVLRLVKSRKALASVGAQLKEVEEDIAKVEKLAEGEESSDQSVLELVQSSQKAAQELIKALAQAVDRAVTASVASAKKQFTDIKERGRAAAAKLIATKKAAGEPRERVLSEDEQWHGQRQVARQQLATRLHAGELPKSVVVAGLIWDPDFMNSRILAEELMQGPPAREPRARSTPSVPQA
ncbi:unnamed protein product, partial [Prorocentrum cordatum]